MSSTSSRPYKASWHNNASTDEDPTISLVDYPSNKDKVLYRENKVGASTDDTVQDLGMNVYVRNF